ncbi:Uncharacterized protein SAMN06265222_101679 [Neorhodopirellula lusitana]|uniref:HisA/hisF family protein n=1 Tax=Neorhodopirellula lusitana TaxID=445327 RepID=A0ABY1PR80_9BACT|nr:HisA/HisF-related TIM barrel protein [Neorhodopirellula lusitana]SMP41916.1 Uncharacterized protein SAMN06265222_101679 [Neorhodopirellula lusitana]
MSGDAALSWDAVVDNLVGVIDLKEGKAVHAVAGARDQYGPVQLPRQRSHAKPLLGSENASPATSTDREHRAESVGRAPDGDAIGLVEHYRSLGVHQFYVADLDALEGGEVQRESLDHLLDLVHSNERWILDLGLNDQVASSQLDWMQNWQHRLSDVTNPSATDSPFCSPLGGQVRCRQPQVGQLQWVVASESANKLATPAFWAGHLGRSSLILGVDFRDGAFASSIASLGSTSDRLGAWLKAGQAAGIQAALILDVAAVGTGVGPRTATMCEEISRLHSGWRLISGGGCRDAADVAALLRAGCNDCLVATALLR